MKIYKVPLYRCSYNEEKSGENILYLELTYIDDVIVKKRLLKATELITGYRNIDVKKADFASKYKVSKIKSNSTLIIFDEDCNEFTLASEKDIEKSVDHYENSNWKKEYEKIKKQKGKVYSKK